MKYARILKFEWGCTIRLGHTDTDHFRSPLVDLVNLQYVHTRTASLTVIARC